MNSSVCQIQDQVKIRCGQVRRMRKEEAAISSVSHVCCTLPDHGKTKLNQQLFPAASLQYAVAAM